MHNSLLRDFLLFMYIIIHYSAYRSNNSISSLLSTTLSFPFRTYIPIIQNVYLVLDLPDSYQYLCHRYINYQPIYFHTNMQVAPKKTNTIHYLPQEIKETRLTEVTYLPITREMLEQLFSNSAKKDKHRLVKKRRK